jgi:plastocyanin
MDPAPPRADHLFTVGGCRQVGCDGRDRIAPAQHQEVRLPMPRLAQASLAVIAGALVVLVLLGAVALGAGFSNHPGDGRGMMDRRGAQVAASADPSTAAGWGRGGMMGRSNDSDGHGMMGGTMPWANATTQPASTTKPGDAGFVPGTSAAPRVINFIAGPGYTFSPSTITVQRGETITFVVTAMGPYTHEFLVGPADAVAADSSTGTSEITGITMMQSKSLTYTFDGTGPYAYACQATGHYDAGMKGTITVVG